ncbi:TVP38/TMEM64 family membrane protein [Planoprotostelium fungivorum]|uniref:TVP38/TMEM64 family membrane protein n=1 Tax=Planoprotostelium fungivorum TaxID=1890364 RepID=A0A2P6NWM8_9EUKA|nr:TVP38/TMEM64 family membrane protein [Planoprotostelium fungivorum]
MMLRLLILILFIVTIAVTFFILAKTGVLEKFLIQLRKAGYWGLVAVAVGEVIAGLPIPNLFTLFAMFGGFAYGWWRAFLVAYPFACVGYCVGFLFSRRFLRDRVKKTMEEEFPLFSDIDELVEQEGFKFVTLLRFSPIPFGILNMLLATTKIPFATFALAGIVPTAVEVAVFCYIGTTLEHISEALSGAHLGKVEIAMIIINVLATILCIVLIYFIGKKAYARLQARKAMALEKNSDAVQVVIVTQSTEGEKAKGEEDKQQTNSSFDTKPAL